MNASEASSEPKASGAMEAQIAHQFEAPRRVEDAVALLAKHGVAARVLAGGTDLLAQMKSGTRRPAVIVDLKRIDERFKGRWFCDVGVRSKVVASTDIFLGL